MIRRCRDRGISAAAIRHLTRDDPPVYLTYGGPDVGGMDKLGVPCELKAGPDTIESYVAFFIRPLKKAGD